MNKKIKTKTRRYYIGIMTLSVVISILVIAALFSFAVMQTGRDHIKKMQNFVVSNQEKTHVNGSLNCAIAVFNQHKLEPSSLDLSSFEPCKTDPSVEFSLSKHATYWQLTASKHFSQAKSIISYIKPQLASFMTSGNVEIVAGNTWFPATGNKVNGDYVECFSIIAKGEVKIDLTNSVDNFIMGSPIKGECLPNSQSHIWAGTIATNTALNQDIKEKQSNLNIFKLLFRVDKSQWQSVRDKFDKVIVTGSAIDSPFAVQQCGALIKDAIDMGKELIWIEGDCLLDGLSHVGGETQSILIVIQNGVVGSNSTIDNAKVTVFQFVLDHPDGNLTRSWGVTSPKQCNEGAMKNQCLQLINLYDDNSLIWATLPFYFSESTTFTGSYLVDIHDSLTLIRGKLTLGFDSNLTERTIIKGSPQILKGSLHDF